MSKFILAIDQGTTGTTACLVNTSGELVAKVNQEFRQIFPKSGWVEHDPEDIWESVNTTIKKVLAHAGTSSSQIATIGITNQRETVLLWDRKTGAPVHNAIVWQCRRTTDFCEKLKKTRKEKMIQKKTGLLIDPYFSGSKIQWLLKNVKGVRARVRKGEVIAGTIDSFLLWRLTGGKEHKTDVTNASRTQLMNLEKGEWDKQMLKLFEVPREILPEIVPSSGEFGRTSGIEALPDGIPITGIAGDQQAALFGQACFGVGEAKCTFGTGSFLLMNTGHKQVVSSNRLLTTVAWQLQGQKKMTYALEGGAFICGAAVQWLRDGLGLIEKSSDIEALAASVDSTEGVEFVPALTGLGAPHWVPEARGVISGLTRGSTKAHLARATLEGMALQNAEILQAMQKDARRKLKNVKVDGGASANQLLMQIQSNYIGAPIIRPQVIETTVAGAAYLAGLGVGIWKSTDEIEKIWQKEHEFQNQLSPREINQRLKSWKAAVSKA